MSAAARTRRGRWLDELVGLLLLASAVLLLLSLASYDVRDPNVANNAPSSAPVRNWVGRVGANMAEPLFQLFGVCAFLLPVIVGAVGWNRFRGQSAIASYGKLLGYGVVLLSLCALTALVYGEIAFGGETFGAGGNVVGAGLAAMLVGALHRTGAIVVSAALLAAGIVLATRFSFARALDAVLRLLRRSMAGAIAGFRAWREARQRAARKKAVLRKHSRRLAEKQAEAERAAGSGLDEDDDEDDALPAAEEVRPAAPRTRTARVLPVPLEAASPAAAGQPRQATLPMPPAEGGFALPPLELLNQPEPPAEQDDKELLSRARQLTDKFHEFQVEGTVVAIHPGPVVTTFEFKPEAGVKYSKITSLVDDLCLGLKAESVRIDRLPGRSTVGIEVPNRRQETIYPRELLASERFAASRSKLTLALGKDISGEVFTAELDRMPHLLIAGATGAGKSVGLNAMIASILYKATPADARFIMIDTKMIELGIYADIPHLLVPVVTEPKHASTALAWAVKEMERRYRQLASLGVRNIDQFNAAIAEDPARTMTDERTGETTALRKLPFLVIVIDEMADLMMVSSADVEESVMRLAQMARAVGIHLILATQRPSVDVITGTIKANFPARIAFRVSQRVDSRTIIDGSGAEQLLGRGDMLFLPPGSARLVRLHGGYITEAELQRVVTFLKKQARPVYDESVLVEPEEERPGWDGGERDAMFVDAVRLVLQEGQCSITLIQRRMRLGYARAARIVDSMEREGIIGPADGARPREVLVGPEVLESLERGLPAG